MLTNNQINELVGIAQLKASYYGDLVIGVIGQDLKKVVSHPYDDFRKRLGLEDIRFHWLCSDRVYLGGGSCLNWIWGENKNEDIDFFFKNPETVANFKLAIQNWGFKETKDSKYASTFFHPEEKIIVQLVGANKDSIHGDLKAAEGNGFIPYGTPEETLSRFDFDVCKFAIDADKVYFTQGAVVDLIQKRVSPVIKKHNTQHRLVKYSRKGFFIPLTEPIPLDESNYNDTY